MKVWAPLLVRIIDTDTGQIAEVSLLYEGCGDGPDPLRDALDWNFADAGRYSCDHDRAMLLGLNDVPHACGGSRFRVEWIKDAWTDEILYEESA